MRAMKLILLSLAAAFALCGCSTVGRAVGMVARPVGTLLNAATGPVRGMTN